MRGRAGLALTRGRRAAEALMVDSCTVRRVSGTSTNTTTGAVTPTYSTVYTGKCKVQQGGAQAGTPEAGDHAFTVQGLQLHLPVGAGPVAVGDVVTVTASAHDAQLVNRQFRVTAEHHKTWATAQRIPIEEVQA